MGAVDFNTPAQTGADMHSDVERVASRHSANAPPPATLAGEADAELLGGLLGDLQNEANSLSAKLGYKQELRRNFTMIEVFGIAFSIMGLLPSIASTLSFTIPAGPVGMVRFILKASKVFLVDMLCLGMGLVLSIGVYIRSRCGNGRSWKCYAYFWRLILVVRS